MTLGEHRTRVVRASAARTWTVVEGVGGPAGWYAFTRLWRVRAALDRLAGGPGMRGRPDRPLRTGDVVDFWVVEAITPGRSLTLRAQMRMPGTARMTLTVTPDEAGDVPHPSDTDSTDTASTADCELEQVITFVPRGIPGRLYWSTQLPAHRVVFAAMLRGMARAAERG